MKGKTECQKVRSQNLVHDQSGSRLHHNGAVPRGRGPRPAEQGAPDPRAEPVGRQERVDRRLERQVLPLGRRPGEDQARHGTPQAGKHYKFEFPAKTRRAISGKLQYDGEFWMEFFTDFCREFEEVSICTLGPDFNHDGVVEAAEAVKVTFGEWLPGTGNVSES